MSAIRKVYKLPKRITMNREEQIITYAKKHYYDDINCFNAFIHGVGWAELHPADVWHDTSEEPNKYEYILFEYVSNRRELKYFAEYVTKNSYGMLQEFEKFGKCRWAYVKDLLPK